MHRQVQKSKRRRRDARQRSEALRGREREKKIQVAHTLAQQIDSGKNIKLQLIEKIMHHTADSSTHSRQLNHFCRRAKANVHSTQCSLSVVWCDHVDKSVCVSWSSVSNHSHSSHRISRSVQGTGATHLKLATMPYMHDRCTAYICTRKMQVATTASHSRVVIEWPIQRVHT